MTRVDLRTSADGVVDFLEMSLSGEGVVSDDVAAYVDGGWDPAQPVWIRQEQGRYPGSD